MRMHMNTGGGTETTAVTVWLKHHYHIYVIMEQAAKDELLPIQSMAHAATPSTPTPLIQLALAQLPYYATATCQGYCN
jgi:hypothetical protein